MKKYYLNKKEILFWANKARRYLKLPPIELEIDIVNIACQCDLYFNPFNPKIHYSQICNDLLLSSPHPMFHNKTNLECLILSIFHEIAHYFQYFYYNK